MKHGIAWVCGVSLAVASGLAAAAERTVYRTTGEHGEVVFSDVAAPDAEQVVVETGAPVDDPLAELDRRIEQTLNVADSLEASRLAREEARAEARAEAARARAAAAPEVVYQDRYVESPYLYPRTDYRWRHGDRGHHRPPHKPPDDRPEQPERPRRDTISKAFPPLD